MLLQLIPNTATTTSSQFTFVVIPLSISPEWSRDGVPAGTRVKDASNTQTYVNLAQLVATLANQPYADRVINYSCVFQSVLFVLLKVF